MALKITYILSLLSLFLFLTTPILTTPVLKDIHQTDVDIYTASTENAERFVVRVERVDAVLDVDENDSSKKWEFVAGRQVDVLMGFDVLATGDISINGQPIPIGTTTLKTEAHVSALTAIKTESVQKLNLTNEEVLGAFDLGIVSVEVTAEREQVLVEGVEVTAITIREKILEVDGVEVVQNEAIEQLFLLSPDGTLTRHPCRMHHTASHPPSNCLRDVPASFLLFSASVMFISMLGFARCLVFCCAPPKDDEEEMEEGKIIEGVDFSGKGAYGKVLETEEREEVGEDLPVYERGYVAVKGEEEK